MRSALGPINFLAVPDAVLVVDTAGRLVDVNQAARRLLDGAHHDQAMTALLALGATAAEAERLLRESGASLVLCQTERVLAVRSAPVVERLQPAGRVIVVCDVSERERAAAALRARCRLLLALLRHLELGPTIVVPLIARGRTLGAISLVREPCAPMYTAADLATAEDLARRAALAIDNARLYQRAQAAQAAAEAALQEVRESQAQLVQAGKLAAIGTLAAGVAHELNQPLMVICGQTQMLQANSGATDQSAAKLARIVRQTDKMSAIIDHLRAFGRAGDRAAGETVDVNAVVQEALLFLESQLREQGIELCLRLAAEPPQAHANANEVEQIVFNVLVNARDALSDAALAVPSGRRLVVRTWTDAAGCHLTVTDDGPGIPSRVLPRLFEPFYTTKPVGQGTGLGLPISRDIARRWGGDLTLDNRADGPGAVAHLTLLSARRPAGALGAAASG